MRLLPERAALARALVTLGLAAAVGCASSTTTTARRSPRTVETLPDGTQIICEQERPTGSHLYDTVCRTYSPVAAQKMRNDMVGPRSGTATPPGS